MLRALRLAPRVAPRAGPAAARWARAPCAASALLDRRWLQQAGARRRPGPSASRRWLCSSASAGKPPAGKEGEDDDDDGVIDPATAARFGAAGRLLRQYGVVGALTHVGISWTSLLGIYVALRNGVDLTPALQAIGFGSFIEDNDGLAQFGLALAIYKLIFPLRGFLSVSLTPTVVRTLGKKRSQELNRRVVREWRRLVSRSQSRS